MMTIPKCDRPEITSPNDFDRIAKELYLDRRKFITRSFTLAMDKEDAWQMKKNDTEAYLPEPVLKQLAKLYSLLRQKGFMNIFFCTKEELSKSLYGEVLHKDTLKYRLEKLRVSGILRIYHKDHGVKHNLWKVCINPSYGYKWQDVPPRQISKHDRHGMSDEEYAEYFGTYSTSEGQLPSPITSSFYSSMNHAKDNWVKSLNNVELNEDRLVLEMCQAQGTIPTYLNERPVWIVNTSYKHIQWLKEVGGKNH